MKKSNNHKQIHISFSKKEADVDEEMAPIILGCWRHGIDTFLSCQENQPGIAWIDFASVYDATRFMNIVCDRYSEEPMIYNRVTGICELKNWKYNILPYDFNLFSKLNNDKVRGTYSGKPEFAFSCSIRFPRTDMRHILEKLKQA